MKKQFTFVGKLLRFGLSFIILVLILGCGGDKTTTPKENHAPTITSVTTSPASLSYNGGNSTVTVVANDQDGDALTYTYSAPFGTISGSGSTVTWTLPANTSTNPISHTISVTVSDGKLNASSSAGCVVDGKPEPTTGVAGTLSLPGGHPGDLSNTLVAIYANINDWANYAAAMSVAAVGSGATVTYSITNVPPGTYYIDAWKDIDNSQDWTPGDLVGWHGSGNIGAPSLTPITVTQGNTTTINISMIDIP